MQINEGGNIFKNPDGQPETKRIDRQDVKPTVAWLEKITDLPLVDNMLGSTGQKATSGDLDLAVDSNSVSKEDLYNKLTNFVKSQGQDPAAWVKKSGISVHFKTPILGNAKNGFVQTDFMFMAKPEFSKFVLRQAPDSNYKGASRNVLINSIAKSLGYKLNQNLGIMDRATNELISDDPDQIAKMLLNKSADRSDLDSVEHIMSALKNDPNRDKKIADFLEHMNREGTPYQEPVSESDSNIMARLRDRIVNQGMQVIVEGARIEHPEDLVFSQGSRGIQQALNGIVSAAKNPQTNTIKWDGKPAVIFGRNESGQFVLTDKSGFTAKGYQGLATSPEEIADMMNRRGGERGELIAVYRRLFPLLKAAVPDEYRGYIQADLLFSRQPEQKGNAWIFQPNTVTYQVPTDSKLGQRIADSQVGIAIHTQLSAPGADPKPIQAANLNPVRGLLILDPVLRDTRNINLDPKLIADVKKIISQYGPAIDQLFSPAALRERKISDMPKLIQQYINNRVRSGSYNNLIGGFGPWVKTKAPTKAPRIFEWATENKSAVAALFQAFLDISALKNSLVQQLDSQSQNVHASINGEPGHEGYVGNNLKFVDRMRFSSANFALNNPELK